MEEFRDITMQSRDGFTARRNWTSFRVRLFPIRFEFRRRGGTDLEGRNRRAKYGSWMAMDSLSWHQSNFRCSFSGCR